MKVETRLNPAKALEVTLDPYALAAYLSEKVLIDGHLVASRSGRSFPVFNPATGQKIAEAADCDGADVDVAMAAAVRAHKTWGRMAARERGKLVMEAARKLSEHAEEIARLVALETGKALRTECRPETSVVADTLSFFAGLAPELKGETIPLKPTALAYTVRESLGVVAAVLPWNVPVLLLSFKIGPALVAGNTVVVKSAEEAPLGVLRTIEVLNTVLPPGVLNILSGDGPGCGAPLVNHRDVRKITFTGSVETGKIIAHAAAEKLVPVTLELGGKSPMIVMDDADLDRAIEGAVTGMRFTRQGQSCTAASRMLIQDGIYDTFVERLKERVDRMVMGDPLDEATDMGTIISQVQFDRVQSYVTLGEQEPGAKALHCSTLPTDEKFAKGLFFQPVIFTDIGNDSRLAREEIFGPVTCAIRFQTYEDAIAMANDSVYGLAATIWTTNLKFAMDAAQRLEAGIVQVNQNQVAGPNMSFGGVKSSGLGKEVSLESMLDHFTHKKTVIVNLE